MLRSSTVTSSTYLPAEDGSNISFYLESGSPRCVQGWCAVHRAFVTPADRHRTIRPGTFHVTSWTLRRKIPRIYCGSRYGTIKPCSVGLVIPGGCRLAGKLGFPAKPFKKHTRHPALYFLKGMPAARAGTCLPCPWWRWCDGNIHAFGFRPE